MTMWPPIARHWTCPCPECSETMGAWLKEHPNVARARREGFFTEIRLLKTVRPDAWLDRFVPSEF